MNFHFSPRPNRAHEIQWRPWSAAAFAEARSQDKPVLLAISAVWCHWCHVMDETTYSSPEVARLIDEHYIPIRVDNDRRPDVNARYNMGGWPTTAMLTPEGMTLTGGTYVPEAQMLQMLQQVEKFYHEHKFEVAERTAELHTKRRMQGGSKDALRDAIVVRVLEEIAEGYDEIYGGFGTQPKFPQTEQLELLLLEYRLFGDERLYEMASKTMRAMAGGGMYDGIEGGFFRYSTTRDWSVPHFEKMTEDHAGLLRVLATLCRTRGGREYRPTLRSASDFLLAVIANPGSPFFGGSQDADEAYYAAPREERRKQQPPYVDRTVYANWNALLASSFYATAIALDDDGIAQRSTAIVDGLHERMRDPDGLLYHFAPEGGSPQVRGLLTDQAAYLRALIDAHEYTGAIKYVTRASDLLKALDAQFAHADGPFDDHASLEDAIGNLAIADRPLHDNALIADSLLRLSALTNDEALRERAETILTAYARTYGQAGTFAASYARSVRRALSPAPTLFIVGGETAASTFREAAHRLDEPLLTIGTLEASDAQLLRERGYESIRESVAYFCRGKICAPPVHDPARLAQTVAVTAPSGAPVVD